MASFVAGVRDLGITPHVAQKVRGSAIDGRTTRHPGYAISQRKRKLIEQVFGWMKTVGGLRKLRHRGGELVDWIVTFTAAAYNLIRLRTLLARGVVSMDRLHTRWVENDMRHIRELRFDMNALHEHTRRDASRLTSHFFIVLLVLAPCLEASKAKVISGQPGRDGTHHSSARAT